MQDPAQSIVPPQPYHMPPQPPCVGQMPNQQIPVGVPLANLSQPQEARIVIIKFGRTPTAAMCPDCGFRGLTRVHHEARSDTGIIMCVLCIVFWPAMFIPLCVESCKTTVHHCGNCNRTLGIVKPDCCD
eukprot:TRINITY_DN7459_c0_g1_i4.p3 TRINITY_DN7459_c0_g1~~TRINITY_DN7459_c0_g1_i4.p3  ORF type:complete len:129 (-),score=15.16 TRINITY_DN7459_c0_g1_i4:561-947(-)